jgi:hypothetical protein
MTADSPGEAEAVRQVLITSTFVDAPEEVLTELGLRDLFAETSTVSNGFVLDPNEAKAILDRFKETEGVDLLAAPRVSMLDGKQAQISSLGPGKGSWNGLVGASADVVPRISADGLSVELTVIAGLAERDLEPPNGAGETLP